MKKELPYYDDAAKDGPSEPMLPPASRFSAAQVYGPIRAIRIKLWSILYLAHETVKLYTSNLLLVKHTRFQLTYIRL